MSISASELLELCEHMRNFIDDCMDNISPQEYGNLDSQVQEMLETMQSAWEEGMQVLKEISVEEHKVKRKGDDYWIYTD